MQYLIAITAALVLTACTTSAFVNPGDISYSSKFEDGVFPREATVMVVGIQQSNSILLMVEETLLARGINLIADPEIQTQVPSRQVQRITTDTTINSTLLQPTVRQLYQPQDNVDYILRYRYIGDARSLASFTASMIDSKTGMIMATFSYSDRDIYGAHPRATLVLEQFGNRMFPRRARMN